MERNAIFLVALRGCETCFIVLRDEYALRIFPTRLLRKVFGPKREEMIGSWIRRQTKESLLVLFDIIIVLPLGLARFNAEKVPCVS